MKKVLIRKQLASELKLAFFSELIELQKILQKFKTKKDWFYRTCHVNYKNKNVFFKV